MKRFVVQLLIVSLVLAGVLSAPPVMALSMALGDQAVTVATPPAAQVNECSIYRHDSSSQHQGTSTMSGCLMAACSFVADADLRTVSTFSSYSTTPTFPLSTHSGRLLQGPDPYPPRIS